MELGSRRKSQQQMGAQGATLAFPLHPCRLPGATDVPVVGEATPCFPHSTAICSSTESSNPFGPVSLEETIVANLSILYDDGAQLATLRIVFSSGPSMLTTQIPMSSISLLVASHPSLLESTLLVASSIMKTVNPSLFASMAVHRTQ